MLLLFNKKSQTKFYKQFPRIKFSKTSLYSYFAIKWTKVPALQTLIIKPYTVEKSRTIKPLVLFTPRAAIYNCLPFQVTTLLTTEKGVRGTNLSSMRSSPATFPAKPSVLWMPNLKFVQIN